MTHDTLRPVGSRFVKCWICGIEMTVEEFPPEIGAFNKLKVACDPCAAKWDHEQKMIEKREEFNRRRRTLHAQKRISEIMASPTIWMSFSRHEREFEAGNERAWNILRALNSKRKLLSTDLWLWGTKGTGKTTAAHCLLQLGMWCGFDVLEINGPRLITGLLRHDQNLAIALEMSDYILVDDIDKVNFARPGAVNALWQFIAERQEHTAVIYTANMSVDSFQSYLLEQSTEAKTNRSLVTTAISRINQQCLKVEFVGADLRPLARKKKREDMNDVGTETSTDSEKQTPSGVADAARLLASGLSKIPHQQGKLC